MRLLFVSFVLAAAVGGLSAFVGDPPSPAEIAVMLILPAVIALAATRSARSLLWALVLTSVAVLPAYAQTDAGGGGLLDAIRPALAEIAVAVIAAAVAWAAQRFQAWTGIQIEAKHREALQSALANGARSMIENGGEADIMRAVDYVERSVPDALAYLKVNGRDRIRELLKPHVAGAVSLGLQTAERIVAWPASAPAAKAPLG